MPKMYVKVSNGSIGKWPYTTDMLRQDNPEVSFSEFISDDVLSSYGVQPVTIVEIDHDPLLHDIGMAAPTSVDGVWTCTQTKTNKGQEEAEANIRAKRDELLAQTDTYALADRTMSLEMTSYRQALRDVPSQSGFPFSVVWPTNPEAN